MSPHESGRPAWERLINSSLSTHERISLIASIFSDRNDAKTFDNLSGDDAQTFVDVIDRVRLHPFTLKAQVG